MGGRNPKVGVAYLKAKKQILKPHSHLISYPPSAQLSLSVLSQRKGMGYRVFRPKNNKAGPLKIDNGVLSSSLISYHIIKRLLPLIPFLVSFLEKKDYQLIGWPSLLCSFFPPFCRSQLSWKRESLCVYVLYETKLITLC